MGLLVSSRQKVYTQATLVLNRAAQVWLLETAGFKETCHLKYLLCSFYHSLILFKAWVTITCIAGAEYRMFSETLKFESESLAHNLLFLGRKKYRNLHLKI